MQAVVLNIDKENERFSVGIKQLAIDPWDMVAEKYRVETRITGTVTNVTDFGVFVELEEGIEGLIHVSELSKEKGGSPLSRFKIDDVIQAKVINVSRSDKKIGLSIKRMEEGEDKDIYNSYLHNNNEATSNLGELLKKGMLNLQNQPEEDQEEKESDDVQGHQGSASEEPAVDIQAEKIEPI